MEIHEKFRILFYSCFQLRFYHVGLPIYIITPLNTN